MSIYLWVDNVDGSKHLPTNIFISRTEIVDIGLFSGLVLLRLRFGCNCKRLCIKRHKLNLIVIKC